MNRNQIGAVVGVQPFGGEGHSGTGPKAGGPHYLLRLTHAGPDAAQRTPVLEYTLPGPTGETNTLSLHPRGTLLCLGGDTPDILDTQITRALATGNKVIALNAKSRAKDKTISSCTEAEADKLLKTGKIDGVIVGGAQAENVAAQLSKRDGAILPLLSADDDAERFYHERTVTINTTAAGGNATLLAMS